MSTIINKSYEKSIPSSLAEEIYNVASSVASSVRSNPITTVGLFGINMGATFFGEAISKLTGGRVELNNFVPHTIRDSFREVGSFLGSVNERVSDLMARVLRVNNNDFLAGVIVAPIVEELVFRLPLLIASSGIDSLTSELIDSPLLEGVVDLTGGEALKVALAIILSIGFTYAHDNNPSPGRAAGLFAGGLTLSHLTLRPTGGVGNAIVAHAIHNLVPTLLGLEINTGIAPHNNRED